MCAGWGSRWLMSSDASSASVAEPTVNFILGDEGTEAEQETSCNGEGEEMDSFNDTAASPKISSRPSSGNNLNNIFAYVDKRQQRLR